MLSFARRRYIEVLFDAFCRSVIKCSYQNNKNEERLREDLLVPYDTLINCGKHFAYYGDDIVPQQIFYIQEQAVPIRNAALAEALRFITPDKRDVVLMSYFLGCSDYRIAKEMRITPTTVAYRKRCAVTRLREMLVAGYEKASSISLLQEFIQVLGHGIFLLCVNFY